MSLNIETYKVKKMNQLKLNLDRSLRLIGTIEGIGKMTGGDVKQLDEMIAGIKKNSGTPPCSIHWTVPSY